MGNPLDDAMRQLDSNQRAAAEWSRTQEAERERTRAAYRELIRDFLARMNAAGNPGAETVSFSLRRFKTVRIDGWRLRHNRNAEAWGTVFLTTDGRIDDFRSSQLPVPVSEYDFALWHVGSFKDLSLSMAEFLRRHVTGP